jgi:hypothetical protein
MSEAFQSIGKGSRKFTCCAFPVYVSDEKNMAHKLSHHVKVSGELTCIFGSCGVLFSSKHYRLIIYVYREINQLVSQSYYIHLKKWTVAEILQCINLSSAKFVCIPYLNLILLLALHFMHCLLSDTQLPYHSILSSLFLACLQQKCT